MSKAENETILNHFEGLLLSDPEDVLFIDAIENRFVTRRLFVCCLNYYKSFLDTIPANEIVLLAENSVELAILYFAALVAGKIVIPVDPLKGSGEIAEIIQESGCSLVISNVPDVKLPKGVKHYSLESLPEFSFNTSDQEYKDYFSLLKKVDFDSIYSINYTSGTTGKPKGVMHSFRNHYLASVAFSKRYRFSEESIFYHNLPMTYMAGMLNLIFMPFFSGGKIVIVKRFSVQQALNFWVDPVTYKVNAFFLIPAIVTLLNKLDRGTQGMEYCRDNVVTACVGTAPLYPKVQKEFEVKYNIRLYESYGLSETLFVSANSPDSDSLEGVGTLFPGVDILFADDNEILINCPWMFKGYQNLETQSLMRNDHFVTGDAGEFNPYGNLAITDRIKDIIIKGGINLSPKKIEYLIQDIIPGEFVILGIKDESYGEIIACIYCGKLDKKQQQSINDLITSKLGKDCQIDDFREMENLPRNINGKIDKKAIQKLILNDS